MHFMALQELEFFIQIHLEVNFFFPYGWHTLIIILKILQYQALTHLATQAIAFSFRLKAAISNLIKISKILVEATSTKAIMFHF